MEEVTNREEVTRTIVTTIIVVCVLVYMSYNPYGGFTLNMSRGISVIFVAVSLLSIVIKLIKSPWRYSKNNRYSKIKFIRPLVIAITGSLCVIHLESIDNQARIYIKKQAEIATALCNTNGKCPESLEGWVKYDSRYQYKYMVNTTIFTMYYTAKDNIFDIYISYGLDEGYFLHGGVNRPITGFRLNAL